MDGNGIMDEIRELLSQGLSAPEIARKGYASSTVYRVQRDRRRKLGRPISPTPGHRPSIPGWEDWGKLAAENQRLNQRIESLEGRLAEISPVAEWVDKLEATLGEVAARQQQLLQDMAAVQARVDRIDGELDGLAKLYQDDVIGWGGPKWQRRPG